MVYAVRRLCSDFMDMLRHFISSRIITIIIIIKQKDKHTDTKDITFGKDNKLSNYHKSVINQLSQRTNYSKNM